jgi:3',5'-cyclic AMP phosphodiesterase CpdA
MAAILITFLDTFKIPYILTLGNHDGEGLSDDFDIAEVYADGSYSLFNTGPGSIHGYSNYAINLANSKGTVIYSLIMIDTNRYRDDPDGNSGYDYVYPDQISWYEWYIQKISAVQSKLVPSMLFYHIPLPEIFEVKAEMEQIDPDGAKDALRETPCPPSQNTGLFSKIVQLNSTTHMFFGHDHRNLLNYVYQGVHFVYGTKTGPSYYHDDDRLGGTLITVNQAGETKVDFILKP